MYLKQSEKLFKAANYLWKPFYLRQFIRQMSDTSEVIFEEVKNVGIATLNRPKALNALNLNMVRLLYQKLKEWENNKLFVILKGSGEKAFCAGGDIVNITKAGKEGGTLTKEFFYEEYRLNCLIGTYHVPFVSFIDGITMGGGVGLSVHGDYRIATERTVFAMPETGIGLFPDVGGSFFLPRLGGNLGMFLALTGYRLKGRDVLRAGVATHVCDSSNLENLLSDIVNAKTVYPEEITEAANKYMTKATFGNEDFSLKPYLQQIKNCFTGESVEQVLKNLEVDGSEWAKKQVDIIGKMSPTSLKITLEAFNRGMNATLQDCLVMEYRLTQRCCRDHDFYEGVRALLVDRDNSPKWKPDTLAAVTNEILHEYFSPLPPEEELTFA